MTEQTEGTEVEALRADLANAECACGHLAEWHSALIGCNAEDWDQPACDCRGDWLDAVLSVIRAREAAAEARGAERALREAADALNAEPDSRSCTTGTDEAVRIVEWLRAAAAAAARGAEGGAGA